MKEDYWGPLYYSILIVFNKNVILLKDAVKLVVLLTLNF